jgi:type I restriction enzyme S subunit
MTIEKGYKQTEIGIIPEDWKVKSIGEITFRFLNRGTPSKESKNNCKRNIRFVG